MGCAATHNVYVHYLLSTCSYEQVLVSCTCSLLVSYEQVEIRLHVCQVTSNIAWRPQRCWEIEDVCGSQNHFWAHIVLPNVWGSWWKSFGYISAKTFSYVIFFKASYLLQMMYFRLAFKKKKKYLGRIAVQMQCYNSSCLNNLFVFSIGRMKETIWELLHFEQNVLLYAQRRLINSWNFIFLLGFLQF